MINITKKTKNNLRMDAIACTISHKMLFKPWVGPLKLQLHVQFFKWIKFLTPRMHWCNAVSYTESEFDFTVEKIMLNRILMQDWGLRMQCPSFVQVQSPWLRSGILKLARLLCPILSLCHTVWAYMGPKIWSSGVAEHMVDQECLLDYHVEFCRSAVWAFLGIPKIFASAGKRFPMSVRPSFRSKVKVAEPESGRACMGCGRSAYLVLILSESAM